jgi:hypothetical protein
LPNRASRESVWEAGDWSEREGWLHGRRRNDLSLHPPPILPSPRCPTLRPVVPLPAKARLRAPPWALDSGGPPLGALFVVHTLMQVPVCHVSHLFRSLINNSLRACRLLSLVSVLDCGLPGLVLSCLVYLLSRPQGQPQTTCSLQKVCIRGPADDIVAFPDLGKLLLQHS